MTLWFVYSCKGDELINAAINDKSLDKDVRDFAKDVMEHGKLTQEETNYIHTLNKSELENLRTESLKRFSDEAAGDLDITTKVRRRDNDCLQ